MARGLPESVPAWYTGPARRDEVHDLAPPAVGPDRQASPDDLAKRREVRAHTESLLRTASANPKSRHHLVEDQHDPVLIAQPPQSLQESRLRRYTPHVSGDRLGDDAGHVSLDCFYKTAHALEIVEPRNEGVSRIAPVTPGESGVPKVIAPLPCRDQEEVAMAVVVPFELDHLVRGR
jgi:hypothetical protein